VTPAIAASYLAIYFIWGSTYLAISVSIRTLPMFFMSAARFMAAGAILVIWSGFRGAARPTRANLIIAAKSGFIAFFISFGLLVWAEKTLPSSTAALIISLEPAWFVLIDWLCFGGAKPSRRIAAAQSIGFLGIAILVLGGGVSALKYGGSITLYAVAALSIFASGSSWVYGVLLASKSSDSHSDAAMASGLQMFFGGAMFAVASTALAEGSSLGGASAESWAALLYLTLFGSIVAYSCYVFLLRNQPVSKVSTHAFVNPAVAVALGWAYAAEPMTASTLISAVLIVTSVIITLYSK
jgi:drug/metabolite transporter (DMT)-like permease